MRAVVIHAARDVRVEEVPAVRLGPSDVAVKIEAAGICGSDLHYYLHGGFGPIRLKQPLILGHEIAGVVEAVGGEVSHPAPGMRVAINPSLPCRRCRFCRQGRFRHCLDMRFLGSAMRFPHIQGGFREVLTVHSSQALPVAPDLPLSLAAMAEPLAVCLHAARQAGPLLGKKVLVTGCGPIGALSILVAKLAGACLVVATDISAATEAIALRFGAARLIDVAADPEGLAEYCKDKGFFDVAFEASGSAAALRGAINALRPGGIIAQVGLAGDITIPLNLLVSKEVQLRGVFRFDEEFELAVDLMNRGVVDLRPLLSTTLPFDRATEAFELASNRAASMKVQLTPASG